MRARWLVLSGLACVGLAIHVQTRAFVPAAAAFYPVFQSTTGALVSGAALIGTLLGTVGILRSDTNDTVLQVVMPAAIKDVPDGWTADTNPTNPPLPPATAAFTTHWEVDSPGHLAGPYGSASEAAAAGCAAANRGSPSYCGGTTTGWYLCEGFTSCTAFGAFGAVSQQQTCPAGYVAGGGGCNLDNANNVIYPPNSRCGLKFAAGTMSFDSRDPDCNGTPPDAIVRSSDGKTVTATGTNGNSRVQIKVESDGSITITTASPNADGSTTISTVKATNPGSGAPDAGRVTQIGSAKVTGQGPDAINATPQTVGANAPSPQPFPDDYAREGTLQSSVQRLTQIQDALTKTDSAAPADPAAKTQGDIEGVFFANTFSSLLSWQLPARAVACPTWSFSLWGQTYTIDSHCTLIEQQRAVMSSICLLVYGLVTLFIVLGA